jgi:transcriptional regulator with XRE-family HTH domain
MPRPPKKKAHADEELDDIIRNIAERLAAARKARGLTQAQLGAMADMTQQQIFGLEQGTSNVTIRTVARVAKVLDVDLNSLFSKVGSSSDSKLADAIDTFKKILVERGDQDQAFRAEMLELLGRPRTNATCSDVKRNEGIV